MLSSLELVLEPTGDYYAGTSTGSLFHGWLVEHVSPEFADKMHNQGPKPYSQHLIRRKGTAVWRINTLNKDAYDAVILNLLQNPPEGIYLKGKGALFKVNKMEPGPVFHSYKELADYYYLEKSLNRTIRIKTSSPVSFRSDERYQIFPQVHFIFQSLINRWNLFADAVSMEDKETLLSLVKNTRISSYNLRSNVFHLEGVRIPCFSGLMELKVSGPEALARLVGLLIAFGEFSGLGIKTALGMGGIVID